MAEVYVAKTKGIGGFEKLVAIKVIHPRFSEDEHFVQMLVEEAKISVQLNHVNIAQTFDLGCIDDTYYIAMEYVEGGDAFRVQKRARERKIALPVDICCYIAAEICNGLGYAHRKRDAEGHPLGIVHRDISPQNVLVSYAGEVKIVDFGIAKAALRGGQTEVGVIKGKYYYMSPEQAWGDPVDHRTDVFATGLLLHELLTGEMVYQEDNVPALLDRVRKAQVPSPRARRRDVSEELAALILKAVAKEASDRFESAHAFGQELTRLLYQINPTFTASRLAQLMGTLFPEEVRRHSQILKLPTEDLVPVPAPPPPTPSEEVELARMRREEFGPAAESSVIFDLDEVEDMTRNDILPFRRVGKQPSRADRPTAELERPAARREEDTTALLRAGKDEWEEETVLKDDKGAWDESTLVDEGGAAMKEVHALFAQQRQEGAGDDEETQDLAGEKTVAMASFPPAPVAPAARPRPPAPRPAAPARPLPPPRPVGARPPPRPAAPEPEPAELPAEKTVAQAPPDEAVDLPAERTMALAEELPAEKTVAFAEGAPVPARRGAPLAGPSAAGIRLGPEADKFFAPVTGDHPALPWSAPPPSDPFGSAPQLPVPPPPPGHDPFVAQPMPLPDSVEALGKPQPWRLVVPVVLGAVLLALIGAGVTWLVTRPRPASFEIISVPEGAEVTLDGARVPGTTPVTIADVESGRTYRVQLTHPGYEVREAELTASAGENRSVFLLNQIRVTLRVETTPPGAQVWVDNMLRGSAPLEIPGLAAGQSIQLRSSAPGRQTVTRQITLDAADRSPRVVLELPAGP